MNRRHLGKDSATDVLAFDDGDVDPETGLLRLGDIAVSVDTARREAARRNLQTDHELVLYSLHGLLHLLGFRDNTDENRAQMIEAQREVFARHDLPFDMNDQENQDRK